MNDRSKLIVAPLARWSSRIALFSASVLVVGVVLHRLTPFPTPVADCTGDCELLPVVADGLAGLSESCVCEPQVA